MTTHKNKRHTNREAGFTLLELIVSITIILMIIPTIYYAVTVLYDTHARTVARSVAFANATNGVQRLVRDVRGSVYGENGALPVVSADPNSFTFYSDTDMDGQVERVRYYLDGTTMRKGVIEPTSTSSYPINTEVLTMLTDGVMNGSSGTPVFTYYSATSSEITSPLQSLEIRRVTILFETEARFGYETGAVELRSSASIRNLKDTY